MSDQQKFHMRLPRNDKEFLLFLLIVSILSVTIIAPLAAMLSAGFSLGIWLGTIKALPAIWVVVVCFVVLTNRPARWIKDKVISPSDSFNAHIIGELLFNVLLMSLLMTIVGSWIGQWSISWVPFEQFIYNWPRNFAVAFAVEALIAHPIAHAVMHHYHLKKDGTAAATT